MSDLSKPTHIFISYATADGAAFAAELRRDLEACGHAIWQDIVALKGGRDWWTQIEAALKSPELRHIVLVLTPQALARPVIRDEIHLAREQGKTIIPVRGPHLILSTAKLPRHIGQVMDLGIPEQRALFLKMLEGPSLQKPVPMMATKPPADFVARLAEFEAIKARLLTPDSKDGVAITAALLGTTGYGKTTLARKLAYDPDIRDAYFDGTLFVELGQQGGGHIVPLIGDIIGLLDGKASTFQTIEGARTKLGEALGNRRILLIIDDVWARADLEPFLHGGPNTARLITTRDARSLPDDVMQENIAAMTGGAEGEAWRLLASGLPEDQVVACKTVLVALAERRHNWPQALRLANGFLRTYMGVSRHAARRRFAGPPTDQPISLASAIKAANIGLDAKGGVALDERRLKQPTGARERYQQRHSSVSDSMELNLSLLDVDTRARFTELVIFPEDVDAPISLAAKLWRETGNLDRHDTEALLAACDDASLLLDIDFARGSFRFHDSVHEYLQDTIGKDGLAGQHKRLLRILENMCVAGQWDSNCRRYFYHNLTHHIFAADNRKVNPLIIAAAYGNFASMSSMLSAETAAMLDTLLEAAIIDSKNTFGSASPHYLATTHGHMEVMKRLVSDDRIVAAEKPDVTPLHLAAVSGNTEAMKLLRSAGAAPLVESTTAADAINPTGALRPRPPRSRKLVIMAMLLVVAFTALAIAVTIDIGETAQHIKRVMRM